MRNFVYIMKDQVIKLLSPCIHLLTSFFNKFSGIKDSYSAHVLILLRSDYSLNITFAGPNLGYRSNREKMIKCLNFKKIF